MRLQHQLVEALEAYEARRVREGLSSQRDSERLTRHRRLVDLAHKDTDHGWLWAVNPAHGLVLRPDAFVTALRLRLGVSVASYPGVEKCGECEGPFTASDIGNHALVCARGQRVVGHNRIRDHLADLAKVSDSTTATEVAWATALGSGIDGRRPADILTSASPMGGVGSVALDIGITCPHTFAALTSPNVDPLDDYHLRKMTKYRDLAGAAGWSYKPVLMSAFGRPHADATTVVRRLAKAASRTYGVDKAGAIEAAWWRNCGTLLAERAARMVARCCPIVELPRELGGAGDELAGAAPARGGAAVDVSAVVAGAEGEMGAWE
jgi:hypothetical protein